MLGITAALGSGAVFAASGSVAEPWTTLGQRAESSTAQVKLPVPQANEVATQGEVLVGIEAVLGILPSQGGISAEVQAASAANLFAGWLGSASDFASSAPMSRIDLAILATDAMGLTGTASENIGDTSTYGYLTDLWNTGYNLGFANAMLKYGVVPPVSPTRYDAAGAVTTEMLDVALYRMWWNVDVPVTATVTPAQVNTRTGTEDALSVAATNRVGAAVPATNLAQYMPTYTLVGTGATAGSVKGDLFTSDAGGMYTVSVALSGPLLPISKAVTATTQIHVVSPTPPATAPTDITAFLVTGGVSVSWTAGTGATGYEVLYAGNGSSAYSEVSSADGGGSLPSTATSTTVTGLTSTIPYQFEVQAENANGTATSLPSLSVQFFVFAPTGVTATHGSTGIDVSWHAVVGASSYEVLYAASSSSAYSEVSSADGGGSLASTTTSAIVTGLTSGDSYQFEVEAEGLGGTATSGPSSSVQY